MVHILPYPSALPAVFVYIMQRIWTLDLPAPAMIYM